MVPAFAFGMEDLQKRADAQGKAAEACKAKLDVSTSVLFMDDILSTRAD